MQTRIAPKIRAEPSVAEAESILRTCVHCGFCNATCPTYLELGDERDGPRGRIYLIKEMLEGGATSERTQRHLDRCLTCRSCETTCPSGVRFGRLADIGRDLLEQRVPRPLTARLARWLLRQIVTRPPLFGPVVRLGQLVRPLLPRRLREAVPERQPQRRGLPRSAHARTMLVLAGCAQSVTTPTTNAAAVRVFDRLGISLVVAPGAGCCGALPYHLGDHAHGRRLMRRNVDAWWPALEDGAEAIIVTASGCGVTIKEYGEILRDDPAYRDKAARISRCTRDPVEVLADEDLARLDLSAPSGKVAVHCPCTLKHGQKLDGQVERVLARAGYDLCRVADGHLCCGSAGTYSILQPDLSRRLRAKKLAALTVDAPERIVTANVGCQLHLAQASAVPVTHWIELLDPPESR